MTDAEAKAQLAGEAANIEKTGFATPELAAAQAASPNAAKLPTAPAPAAPADQGIWRTDPRNPDGTWTDRHGRYDGNTFIPDGQSRTYGTANGSSRDTSTPAPAAAPTAGAPAAAPAANPNIPAGYVQIDGAKYPTAGAQQGAFDGIQVVGQIGQPGSYLIGRPKSQTVNLPGGPITVSADGSTTPGGEPTTGSGAAPGLPDIKATSEAGATIEALTKLISDFDTSNKATQAEILKLTTPGAKESKLQEQIDDISSRLTQGLLNIEGRPIPIEDIGGEQAKLLKNTAAILAPLEAALSRESTTRQGLLGKLTTAFGFQQSNQELQLKQAELLAKPILEAGKLVQDYVLDLATKYPDAGIALTDSAESAAAKVSKSKIYQGDIAAADATTDDIKEYQFAKTNGYKGSFLEFMDRNEEGGGGSGGGSVGAVTFGAGGGGSTAPTAPTTPAAAPIPTWEEYLAAEENVAGMNFADKKRAEVRKQYDAMVAARKEFDAKQAAKNAPATTSKNTVAEKRQAWIDNPQVDARVKDIVSGRAKYTDYAVTERRAIKTQYEQAVNDGVVPRSTTAAQEAKFIKISTAYQSSEVIKNAVNAESLKVISDQIIKNPGSATNQLKSLYGIVKGLDPDSVVREGEIALAQRAQSYKDLLESYAARITKGQIIHPNTARDLAQAAKDLAVAWQASEKKLNQLYSSQAKVSGIEDLWSEYLDGIEPIAAPASTTSTPTDLSGLDFRMK